VEVQMARLCENGAATFVILEDEGIYDEADIASICERHSIPDRLRNVLWRRLEVAGRSYVDQRLLAARPAQLARIKQDIQLGLRLASQLSALTPETGREEVDRAGCMLNRSHMAALREGARAVGERGPGGGIRLDEAREALTWLHDVYEAAIETCVYSARSNADPEAAWRSAMTLFYTRTLARSWTGNGAASGEGFLADCMAPLLRHAGGRVESATAAPELAPV